MSKQRDIRVRFGRAVRTRRQELGLTQEQLATEAKLNRSYVGDIERGARNIALVNMAKIAQALQIDLPRLLSDYGVEEQCRTF